MQRVNCLSEQLCCLNAFDKAHICTCVRSETQPRYRFFYPEDLGRVRTANNNLAQTPSAHSTMGREMTHKVGPTRDRIACNDGGTYARDELFAGDDLLAHQVPAALALHLVLDVHRCNTSTDVLVYSARNHGRTTESNASR